MDPALLKQRQDFMKSAIKSMGVIPQRAQSSQQVARGSDEKPAKSRKASAKSAEAESRKADAVANSMNFSVMAKIVDYMKKRHLNQQSWGLALRDIMEEMQLYDISKRTEEWLQSALQDNQRIHVEEDGKFIYNPPYKVKNRTSLLNILRKNYVDGKGGLLLSELNECIADADQLVKSLGNQVIQIPSQYTKRKDFAYFYNDPELDYAVDEDFVQLWRQASVDHLDEKKIEEYLLKHGIATIKDATPRRLNGPPKRKQTKRRVQQRVHNEHLADVLEDYGAL